MSLPELHLQTTNRAVLHFTIHVTEAWDATKQADPFDLDAPYQRPSVWSVEQRRNLIKSLLMGLPIGSVTVAHQGYDAPDGKVYRVVDGKQRIETLRTFATGGLAVPAEWWTPRDLVTVVEGFVTSHDLTDRGRRRFENCTLGCVEYDPTVEWSEDPTTSKFRTRRRTPAERLQAEAELYLLLNFGGVPQTDADRARAERTAR